MRSLSGLARRSLEERRGRTLLTAAGVALGVALFVGSVTAALSVSAAFRRISAGGGADAMALPASGAGTLPASTAEAAGRLPGVVHVSPMVSFGTSVSTAGGRSTRLEYNRPAPVQFLGLPASEVGYFLSSPAVPGPGQVILSRPLAQDLAVSPGQGITLDTPTGRARLVVAGVAAVRPGTPARVAVGSLATAEGLAGAPGEVSAVAVKLAPGTDVAAWIHSHTRSLGPAARIREAADGPGFVRQYLSIVNAALAGTGLAMVFAGGYLVYVVVSTRVAERVRLYGILYALGATRPQVRRMVLSEAAMVGAAGGVAGTVAGFAVAALLLRLTARQLVYWGGAGIALNPVVAVAGVLMGVLSPTVAALLPARRAARLDPVEAISETHAGPGADRRPPWWALPVMGLGAVLLAVGGRGTSANPGLLLVLVGAGRSVSYVVPPLARRIRGLTGRLVPGVGGIAANHVASESGRSARTVAITMMSMSLVLGIGGLYVSMVSSLNGQISRQSASDLVLTSPSSFDPTFVAALSRLPGVAAVTPGAMASASLTYRGQAHDSLVTLVDPATYFSVSSLTWSHTDGAAARRALQSGGAVLVPAAAEQKLGIRAGSVVLIDTDAGPRPFRVAGFYESSNTPLTIVMAYSDGRRALGVGDPSSLTVRPIPGTSPGALSADIRARLGGLSSFVVSTVADARRDADSQARASFGAFLAVALMGSVFGMIGLAAVLAIAVIERYREIAVIRAVGARRRQVLHLAMVESGILALAALILAVPVGALISVAMVRGSALIGYNTFHYHFPWAFLPVLVLLAAGTALVGGAWPARQAGLVEIDSALRFE